VNQKDCSTRQSAVFVVARLAEQLLDDDAVPPLAVALRAELGFHLLDRARFGFECGDALLDPLVVDPGDRGHVLDRRDACGEHRRCHSGQVMCAPDETTTGNQVAAPVSPANTINDD
jgi:hypothetical protein